MTLINKIFVADDEPDIIRLVKFVLEKKGYIVKDFSSGKGIIDEIKKDHPDLVILDVMMPGENGTEICEKIKNNSEINDIPVIILSAKTQKDEIEVGMQVGADQYLIKPFNTDELLEVVEKTIK